MASPAMFSLAASGNTSRILGERLCLNEVLCQFVVRVLSWGA